MKGKPDGTRNQSWVGMNGHALHRRHHTSSSTASIEVYEFIARAQWTMDNDLVSF